MLLKQSLKTQSKLKELEIMYQNTISICFSWYSKVCRFLMKKSWSQKKSSGVSHDLYINWIFFRWGITVLSFVIVGYVWQILKRRAFLPLYPGAAPKRPILNRMKRHFLGGSFGCLSHIYCFNFFLYKNKADLKPPV